MIETFVSIVKTNGNNKLALPNIPYSVLLTADIRRDFPPFCLFILLQTRLKLSSILLYLLFYPSEVDRRKKTERYCHLSVKTMLL
jgi:hypothetical protein